MLADVLFGSERGHELEVLGVAHRRDVGAEVLGELHPCGADGPGRAVDEDPLPLPRSASPQPPQPVGPPPPAPPGSPEPTPRPLGAVRTPPPLHDAPPSPP